MEKLFKFFPVLAVFFAAFTAFNLYEERELEIEGLDGQIVSVQAQIEKNKKTKNEIQEFYKNIELEKAKIDKIAQEIEKMQQIFPNDISDNENMTLVRSFANDINIKEIQSISPLPDEDKGFYTSRGYSFKAKATYLQFLILFEKIGDAKRIFNIRQVKFEKPKSVQRGKFQVIEGEFEIETYKINPNYVEEVIAPNASEEPPVSE